MSQNIIHKIAEEKSLYNKRVASISYNKKISFNYEIVKKFEAGIELFGFEVKSLRTKNVTLDGAYVIIRGGEVFLSGLSIAPYQAANAPKDYDPIRLRRLLLSKKEIAELAKVEAGKSLTIVPISVYNKGGRIKLEIAVVRGKKKFDKRESIKKRDIERDIGRTLKN